MRHLCNVIKGNHYWWVISEDEPQILYELSSSYNFSPAIMRILLNRGFDTKDKIDAFLFSQFDETVFHPSLLKDAEKAVERILKAIKSKEKVLIAGDYDVDGITATAMMILALAPLGANVNYFLPHRVRDGYGLSAKVVKRAAENGYSLIVTVDNGITAHDAAGLAESLNIDLIITDHHRPHEKLPAAYAIVDPVRSDCLYDFKSLAGVGVAFKVLSLLYEKLNKTLPDKVYELLMLGTIADVVPLVGENRYWVQYGLRHVHKKASYSLDALRANVRLGEKPISSTDIAFFIAPQLNALGRLEDPREGVQFLIGARRAEVDRVGKILHELNEARKEIERLIFSEIDAAIISKQIDLEKENVILAASKKWPPGVIGLVASKLVAAYGRPVLLFHLTKKGIAKGSCRSIPEFNIFDALREVEDILDHFGGHSCAAGLSLSANQLPILKERLEGIVAQKLTLEDLQQKIKLEASVGLSELDGKFADDLHYLEPFGHMNEAPLFYIKQVTLLDEPRLFKDKHVRCRIFSDGVIKPIIFFNKPELFELLIKQSDKPFDVAAIVIENYWQGMRSIELQGIDIAL